VYAHACSGLTIDGVSVGQVIVANCTGATLANLTIVRAGVGVEIAFSDRVEVRDSAFADDAAAGVSIHNASNVRIARTSVVGSTSAGVRASSVVGLDVDASTVQGTANDGIVLDLVSGAALTGNVVSDNAGVGLRLSRSSATFTGNRFERDGTGALIDGSSGVTVSGNNFSANQNGIDVAGSTGVRVWHNSFWQNARSADADGASTSTWDDGYPSGGNFWSDYTGWDDCGGPAQDVCPGSDGLGDTPYVLGANAEDRYPLVPVNPTNAPPVASFYVEAPYPYPGQPLSFVAVDSYDPEGWPLTYGWDFGDGATATLSVPDAIHAYAAERLYTVTLTVTDVRHATASMTMTLAIVPIPILPLELYEHPAGFRLPVPVGWTRQVNVTQGSNVTELMMSGSVGGLPASILVDTDRDPTVRETHDYLDRFVTETLAQIRIPLPNAYLDGAPDFRTIANHSAVSFVIRYTGLPVVQKVAYVVSEAHTRSWFLLLTAGDANFVILNATFERMLAGFEITLAPNPTGILGLPILVFGGIVAGAAVAVVVAVLVLRARGRRPPAEPPVEPPAVEPPVPPAGPQDPEGPLRPGV